MEGDFRLGDWLVRPDLNRIEREDERKSIEPKVIDVLVYLADHPKEVLSKKRILDVVWANTFVGDEVLTNAIGALRKALGDDARSPAYIETIPRRGYRLIAPVIVESQVAKSRYRVLEEIGHGAMGKVFLAEDRLLKRKVALKLLLEELAEDDNAKKRFVREARAAAALDHPFICSVHDTGELEGRTFIAMEYLEGQTLEERIAYGPLSLGAALKIASEVAEALEKAHAAGIIHRDLKPANIMLAPEGHAKVMDFGLAKQVLTEDDGIQDLSSTLTREGALVGTISYMSPEQVRGDPVDQRSDIFSLGVVLYQMLTGVHPFRQGRALQTVSAILVREHAPLEDHLHDISERLEQTVRRMLDKNPEQRPQQMKEVREELEEIRTTTDSTVIRRRSRLSRGLKPAWLATGIVATSAIALALAIFFTWAPPSRLDKTRTAATLLAVPFTTYPGFEAYPDFSPEGDRIAFLWMNPTLPSFDIYISQIGPGDPFRLTTDPATYEFAPRWSPDGQEIALARRLSSNRIAILTIPALGGTERILTELVTQHRHDFGVSDLSWSPDGRRLAVSYRPEDKDVASVFLLNVDTMELEAFSSPPMGIFGDYYGQFSPDGKSIAFLRRPSLMNWQLHVQPVSGGEARPITFRELQSATGLAWMPDGEEIVLSAGPPQNEFLWRVPVRGGGAELLLGNPESRFHHVAISMKRNRMAFVSLSSWSNDIWHMPNPEFNDSKPLPERFISSTRKDTRALFSPDGRRIAFVSMRTGNNELYLCNSDGTQLRKLTDLKAGTGAHGWSPDGRQLCFDSDLDGNRDIYVLNVEAGAPRRLTLGVAADTVPSWSRDGRWIYFSSNRSGENQIWKMPVEGGDAIQITRGGGVYAQEVPNGKYVYYTKAETRTEVWRIPVEGGEEVPVLQFPLFLWWDWTLTNDGIYFLEFGSIAFLDFASGEIRRVVTFEVEGLPTSLAVSPDERWFLFTVEEPETNTDIMLVENFH